MAERFYINCPLGVGSEVALTGAEAHHLAAVLRSRAGDRVRLFNGDGQEYHAEVVGVGKRAATLRVLSVETASRELGFRLEVAVPLPKGDRAQLLVEKLTELGVTDLVPLRTRRSVVHPGDGKLDKLQRQVIEASKQCGRNVLLRVHELEKWEKYVVQQDLPALRFVAHPGGPQLAAVQRSGAVAVAIGPEGGFTDEEITAALAAGWHLVGLGPRILRVETAAITLAAWASLTTIKPDGSDVTCTS